MNRSDRKLWASARTLADLGDLTARWLEGDIRQTPSHCAPPCAETTELIPVLIAVNRAGFVTDASQPGRGEVLQSGKYSRPGMQRAAVQGFATRDTARLIADLALDAGLDADWQPPGRKRTDYTVAQVVTLDRGEPFTSFGARLGRRDLRFAFDGCHRDAIRAVCEAWQVTVIDPEWGRNDRLWPALAAFAGLAVAL